MRFGIPSQFLNHTDTSDFRGIGVEFYSFCFPHNCGRERRQWALAVSKAGWHVFAENSTKAADLCKSQRLNALLREPEDSHPRLTEVGWPLGKAGWPRAWGLGWPAWRLGRECSRPLLPGWPFWPQGHVLWTVLLFCCPHNWGRKEGKACDQFPRLPWALLLLFSIPMS